MYCFALQRGVNDVTWKCSILSLGGHFFLSCFSCFYIFHSKLLLFRRAEQLTAFRYQQTNWSWRMSADKLRRQTTSLRMTVQLVVLKCCRSCLIHQIFILDYNDHCPVLPDLNFVLKPIPPLQQAPFFVARATDGDSGINAEITYKTSHIIEAV